MAKSSQPTLGFKMVRERRRKATKIIARQVKTQTRMLVSGPWSSEAMIDAQRMAILVLKISRYGAKRRTA